MTAIDFSTNLPLLLSIAMFSLLALLEVVLPGARARAATPGGSGDARLFNNFSLGVLQLAASALLPLGVYTGSWALAMWPAGLFQTFKVHWALELAAALPAHSLAAYWVHRASHRFPLLWRLHAVHHSDEDLDVSSGFRHHPLELALVLPPMLAVNALLGVSPDVAMAAATLAYGAAFWQHAAIRLPARLEALLRTVFVTPTLHRVHHAPERALHDSNYGDWLIVWDRLFGTFRAPQAEPQPTGLPAEGAAAHSLAGLLLRPFRRAASTRIANPG